MEGAGDRPQVDPRDAEIERLKHENLRLCGRLADLQYRFELATECLASDGEEGMDLIAHLTRQREWSAQTFGPGLRTKGICEHIRKELAEIEAAPSDISEWVDVIILGFDGALRTGADPETIVAAWRAKQARNEARQWPDWRTRSQDEAIEHVRTAPEPEK